MTISQSLTAPPAPVPDKDNMTVEEFQTAADDYHQWLPTNNTELTAWTTQANSTASTVNSDKLAAAQSVVDAQSQVSLAAAQVTLAQAAKTAAEAARDAAQGYSESVATLTEGSINDSIADTDMAYSSSFVLNNLMKKSFNL